MNRHKPSVDYLFHSVAELIGGRAVGVILTGMGSDGAAGILRLRQAGGMTIGQDEESCVVYGMPKAAFEAGGVTKVVALHDVAHAIMDAVALEPRAIRPKAALA